MTAKSLLLFLLFNLLLGQAHAQTGKVTAGSVYVSSGDTMVVPIFVDNLSNAAAISLTLQFDPGPFQAVFVENSATFSSQVLVNLANNKLLIAWFSLNPASIQTDTLAKLKFIKGNGCYTNLVFDTVTIGANEITNYNGQIIPVSYVSGIASFVNTVPPALLAPVNGAQGVPISGVQLLWKKAKCAVNYKLQVGLTNNFSAPLIDVMLSDTTYQMSNLQGSTKYYWRVGKKDISGAVFWSAVFDFTTIDQIIMDARLLTIYPPGDTAKVPLVVNNLGLAKAFNWKIDFDPSSLQFLYHQNSLLPGLTLTTSNSQITLNWDGNGNGSSVNSDTLLKLVFLKKINCQTGLKWNASSAISQVNPLLAVLPVFTDGNVWFEKKYKPVLVSPATQATVLVYPLLKWQQQNCSIGYLLRIGTNAGMTNLVLEAPNLIDTAYIPAALAPFTTYYWQVAGKNSEGTLFWSEVRSFTTGAALTPKFIIGDVNTNGGLVSVPVVTKGLPYLKGFQLRIDFNATELDFIAPQNPSLPVQVQENNGYLKLTFAAGNNYVNLLNDTLLWLQFDLLGDCSELLEWNQQQGLLDFLSIAPPFSVQWEDGAIVVYNPQISINCPADISVKVDGTGLIDPSGIVTGVSPIDCGNVKLNFHTPTTVPDCPAFQVDLISNPALGSGAVFPVGSHNLQYKASDLSGHVDYCQFGITVLPLETLVATASPNQVCAGQSIAFSANQYNNATYAWKSPSGATLSTQSSFNYQNAPASSSGNFTLNIQLPFNCQLSKSIPVTISKKPQLVITDADVACVGGNLALKLGVIDTAQSGVTQWIWTYPGGGTSTQQNPVIPNVTIGNSGIYQVTATTSNGCQSTASVPVTVILTPPMPDLSVSDVTACTGDTIQLVGEMFNGNVVSYGWKAPASAGLNIVNNHLTTAMPMTPGSFIYQYFATIDGCKTDTATVTVNIQSAPAIQVSLVGDLDCVDGNSSVQLIESGGEAVQWTWQCASSGFSSNEQNPVILNATAADAGNYLLLAASANGCVSSTSLPVNITDKPQPATLALASSTVCPGESVQLTGTNYGTVGVQYLWQGPGLPPNAISNAAISAAPNSSGSVSYGFAALVHGCLTDTVFATVMVGVAPVLQPSYQGNTFCVNGSSSITLLAGSTGAVTWSWSVGGVPFSNEKNPVLNNVTPAQSGLYELVSTSLDGCSASAALNLQISSSLPPIIASVSGTSCEGGLISLQTNGIPGATYKWFSPQGNQVSTQQNFVLSNAQAFYNGPYYVEVNLGGCVATSLPVMVNVLEAPDPKADNIAVNIDKQVTFSVILNDIMDTLAAFTVDVLQGVTSGQLDNLGNGIFQFTPEKDFTGTVNFIYEICYDDCPALCDFGFVTLSVEYPNDKCIATTIITPNDDGVNEYFKFFCLEGGNLTDNELTIFNQWGDQVFKATPYENDWSGTFNGKELPGGTYFYVFRPGNGMKEVKGFVVIMR